MRSPFFNLLIKDVYYYNEILHLSIKIINDGQLGYNEYNFNI